MSVDIRDLVDELKRRGYSVQLPGISQVDRSLLIVNGVWRSIEDPEKLLETRVPQMRRRRRR